jgi:hypothetical protein
MNTLIRTSVALLVGLAPITASAQGSRLAGAEPQPQSVEQVLAEVRWRFDPAVTTAPAHVSPGEHCLRPLFTRVRSIAHELSAQDRGDVAVRNGLRLAGHPAGDGATPGSYAGESELPAMEQLELTLEGKECIVHYTLTGDDAAPDLAYVKAIQSAVDKAVKKLSKAYRRPYFEPDDGGVDKLHVFVAELDLDPDLGDALAAVIDVQDAPDQPGGKAQTVYATFDTGIRTYATSINGNWKKIIGATAFHEVMHCVQSAYSAFFSRWAVEGQAVWAELAHGKSKDGLAGYLDDGMSVVRMPELPLWHDSIHQYSTAPLFHYLEFFLGKGSNKSFLEESPDTNDAVSILETTLWLGDFVLFSEFYPAYLANLYYKSLKGISKALIPDMQPTETGIATYGWKTTGSVLPTGVRVYEFEAPSGLKTDLLFGRVQPDSGDSGSATPDAVLLHDKNKRLVLTPYIWDDVDGFKGNDSGALLVTDWDYEFPTTDATSFETELFTPVFDVTHVETNSPSPFGDDVEVTFTYDLLGTPVDAEDFGVILFHTIKGPNKFELTQFLARDFAVGTNQEHIESFSVGQAGSYKLHYTIRTPNDAFGGEHTNDKVNVKVKVLKPR